MEDLNKITSTRVGDNIHFFVNGAEDSGTVVKMNTSFVTVVKDDGVFQDIHINDTFFIKDILVNKSWNDMTMEERTVALHDIHAYSPRFLAKSWQQLPKELKDVMLEKGKNGALPKVAVTVGEKIDELQMKQDKEGQAVHARGSEMDSKTGDSRYINHSNVEDSHLGSAGRASHVIETNMDIDATEDYEGQTEDVKVEQFKHESLKPSTKSMQEEIWEQWLDKGEGMGDGGAPAQTSMTTGTTGVYNAVYGKDGRIIGQGKDKDEEEDKDDKKDDKKEDKKDDKKEDKKDDKKEDKKE